MSLVVETLARVADSNERNDSPKLDAEASADLTIDELSARSGVASRTIRFYQSKGLLPAPAMKGRVAFYGARHLERLELVAQLQDRGLRIEAIRELVKRLDEGALDVADWLGLEGQLETPWADDRPRTMNEAELTALFGRKRNGLMTDVVRHAKVERRGADTFYVPSPALLALGGRMESAGIDLELSAKASAIFEKHLGRLAGELTMLFVDQAVRDGESDGTDLASLVEALRPLGLETVRVVFAREMERALRDLVTSGRAAKIPRKKRKGHGHR